MEYLIWELPCLKIDQTPQFEVDHGTGEINLDWEGEGNQYQNVALLYSDDGCPVQEANNWLIHLKTNLQRKQVNTQAQGLLHYFAFLRDIEMSWNDMPIAPRNRPTYKFRKHIKEVYLSGKIARSTAQNYMGVVVNFYKFYLSKGMKFDNPPFNYQVVKIKTNGRHESMHSDYIHIDTTDLRLGIPKATMIGGISRRLMPLSDDEWKLVDQIYRIDRVATRRTMGVELPVPISLEFKLIIDLARFTGMRRQELVTFRSTMVFKPTEGQLKRKYLINNDGVLIGPNLGVETKGSGERRIEIPSGLMLELHSYINSPRYQSRLSKFEKKHPGEQFSPPLFITQNGTYFKGRTLDARWGEIKSSAKNQSHQFDHKFHNLRSTYAVFRLKTLLNNGLKESESLDYLQSVMGHKHRKVLLSYLKFCNAEKSANESYENAINKVIGEYDFAPLIGRVKK